MDRRFLEKAYEKLITLFRASCVRGEYTNPWCSISSKIKTSLVFMSNSFTWYYIKPEISSAKVVFLNQFMEDITDFEITHTYIESLAYVCDESGGETVFCECVYSYDPIRDYSLEYYAPVSPTNHRHLFMKYLFKVQHLYNKWGVGKSILDVFDNLLLRIA